MLSMGRLEDVIGWLKNNFTLYHTTKTLNDLEKEPFENLVGKGENPTFSPFSYNNFCPSQKRFKFLVMFIFVSASALNLNQSKILLFVIDNKQFFINFFKMDQSEISLWYRLNPLPNDIFDWSKLRVLADECRTFLPRTFRPGCFSHGCFGQLKV